MKKQIIFIHGGNPFKKIEDFYEYLRTVKIDPYSKNEKWSDLLEKNLEKNFEVLSPKMPTKYKADYISWKIWFERYLEFLYDESPIIIGYSLGGTFLLKYLSENNFPKKISQLHLVAPASFSNGLVNEDLDMFEFDIKKIGEIKNKCEEIHLYHSEDDPVVLFKNSKLIKENLPNVIMHVFKNRGHFFQSTFPELLEVINKAK